VSSLLLSGLFVVAGQVRVNLAVGRRILLPGVDRRGSVEKGLLHLPLHFILWVDDRLVLHV
jgi:hypothetical protein